MGFGSTNVENIVVLVGVFCANPTNAPAVRLGFVLGSLALLLVSLSTLIIAGSIPVHYLGLLGLIPISLGVYEIVRSARKDGASDQQPRGRSGAREKVALSASTLMVANGGDTIAVFAPLFAETERGGVIVMVVGYLIAAFSLAYLSGRVCVAPQLSEPLNKYGPRLAPYIMIAIGCYILLNTGTDVLPDH